MAKDNKQIKTIWDDISNDAKILENRIDNFGYPIKRRELDDGTSLKLRKDSKAKGSTIEIDKIKIHNEAGEIGDW